MGKVIVPGISEGNQGESTLVFAETLFLSDGTYYASWHLQGTSVNNPLTIPFYACDDHGADAFSTGNGIWNNTNPTEINVPAGVTRFSAMFEVSMYSAGTHYSFFYIDSSDTPHNEDKAPVWTTNANQTQLKLRTQVYNKPCTPGDIIEVKGFQESNTTYFSDTGTNVATSGNNKRHSKLRIEFFK